MRCATVFAINKQIRKIKTKWFYGKTKPKNKTLKHTTCTNYIFNMITNSIKGPSYRKFQVLTHRDYHPSKKQCVFGDDIRFVCLVYSQWFLLSFQTKKRANIFQETRCSGVLNASVSLNMI